MGRTINYYGNQKIYDKEQVDEKLNNKQDKLTIDTALSPTSKNPVENQAIQKGIDKAVQTLEKNIDNKLAQKQDKLTIDNILNEQSSNPVANKAIVEGIADEADERAKNDEALSDAIDELRRDAVLIDDLDPEPTEGSGYVATSGGTWDAIRFASVKVGETMFWPEHDVGTRTMRSDKDFTFTYNGKTYNIKDIPDEDVILYISKNVPDGWHALDGTAELSAEDYPELAEFFGSQNITVDGKIWLPYVRQHIIKISY